MTEAKQTYGTTEDLQDRENGANKRDSYSVSEREAEKLREGSGSDDIRVSREVSPERVLERLIVGTGGIISRLVTEAEERVKYARECIEWYEREEKRELEKLEELRRLAKDFNE